MDPFSVIGAAASVAQLVGLAKDVLRNLWDYSVAVKNAPKHSRELRREMGALAELLESLDDTLDSQSAKPLFTESDPMTGFLELLEELNVRLTERKTKGLGRLLWPFSQDENERLLTKIERYKTTFGLALSLKST